MGELSKRKLESYKRAEALAQEARRQIAENDIDLKRLTDFVVHWMRTTGKEDCFKSPKRPKM